MSDRAQIAWTVVQATPPSLHQDLISQSVFHRELHSILTTTLSIADQAVFRQAQLYNAIRQAIQSDVPVAISSAAGEMFTLRTDQEGEIICENDRLKVILPNGKVFSNDKRVRLEGLRRIALNQLPPAAYASWVSRLAESPPDDADITLLFDDTVMTPKGNLERIVNSLQSGSLAWDHILPSDPCYADRLIGAVDRRIQLDVYAAHGSQELSIALPELTEAERLQLALVTCGHSRITASLRAEISLASTAIETLDWARRTQSPVVMVAACEYFLARIQQFPEIDTALCALMDAIVSAHPAASEETKKGAPYQVFSNLLLALDGFIAQSRQWSDTSIFYRRLLASSQATLIQSLTPDADRILSPMAQAASMQISHSCILATLNDMRHTPRWNVNLFSPSAIHADHLGRLFNAAMAANGLDALPNLKHMLSEDNPDGLQKQVKYPDSFRCGYLEGDVQPTTPLPDHWLTNIDTQLAVRPPTAKSFVALSNAVEFFDFPDETITQLLDALGSVTLFVEGFEDEDDVHAMLTSLATLAAIRKDRPIAQAVGPLIRRYSKDVSFAIAPFLAFRIALMASAAFDTRAERDDWLAKQTEFLAFSDLTGDQAVALRNDIIVLCQVAPNFRGVLSRALSATGSVVRSGPA